MKNFIVLVLLGLFFNQANAQTDTLSSKILNKAETDEFFSTAFKKKNLITFPIFRAYAYTDKTGKYVVALTESADTVTNGKDTVNYTLKAFNFKVDKAPTLKKWEINDFRTPVVKGEVKETSIWFWTKYCEFKDIDGDGIIEPIIVYGTFGTDGYTDGRAKILIYHKGLKVAIRHQNSVSDAGRKTQIDLNFYALPPKIQLYMKDLMDRMVKNNHVIFPPNYLEKMDKKTTLIN